MDSRSILVFGAGAIGSAFAGFLARAGSPVVLYGRGPHWEAVRRGGLDLEGIWGDHAGVSVATLGEGEPWPGPAPSAILLAVKSYATEIAAHAAARFADEDTWFVSLQNGLGNCEILEARFGRRRVVGGRVIFGAMLPRPGAVRITVCAAPVMLGPWPEGAPSKRLSALADAIDRARIPCRTTDRIRAYIWAKVLYNCALNPLSALRQCTYGQLAENPETRARMRQVVEEVYRVAAAEGVEMLFHDAESYWWHFLEEEIPPTAAHRSSMLQAVEAGKPTEIDALSGAIVKLAEKHGLPVPINRELAESVRELERRTS